MKRTFTFRVPDYGFLEVIDEWRRRQPEIPTRAQAVRDLIKKGIEAEKAAA